MTKPRPTLLLTRPQAASEAFWTEFSGHVTTQAEVLISPLINIVPTGIKPDLSNAKGVIFSSVQGVENSGDPENIPAFCIGPNTTQAALSKGWNAEMSGESADALVLNLKQKRPTAPLVHIAGVHRRGFVARRLTDTGLQTTECSVYDQQLAPLSQAAQTVIGGDGTVIVPLFSPRTARQFARQVQRCVQLHIVTISAQVLAEVAEVDARSCAVARTPDRDGMIEMLQILLRRVEAA